MNRQKKARFYKHLLVAAVVGLGFAGCATSPTGLPQLNLVSDAQMNKLGNDAYSQMRSELPQSKNTRKIRYVECISNAITNVVETEYPWAVTVFADEQINAFALPGGKMGVYEGMVDFAENQHQLAAVMAHEVGHVLANHGKARYSASVASQVGIAAATVALAGKSQGTQQLTMAALGLGLQFGVMLPYGRAQESEADAIGLELMAKAGFDPRESVSLWRNMGNKGGRSVPELLSTHPSPNSRMANLSSRMAEPLRTYQRVTKKPNCTI